MPIKYITTDLNLKSKEDLSELAKDLCKNNSPNLNEWVNGIYELRLGSTEIDKQPFKDIEFFCSEVEALPKRAQEVWANCDSRILDIAFEGGDTPNNLTSLIDENVILRLSKLKLGIEITIYHTGLYSHLD